MFKRLFFTVLGIGIGVAVGIWAVRKVEDTSRRLRPDALASSAADRAAAFGDRLRLAVEQGRVAAARKETELRTVYRVDTSSDLS
ncbi:MAG: hypothetical protein GEU81_04260 [Nitriliruptorales bacterium]|nr:hypothetical protein [Nitriliruptorales bacterium]